MTVPSTSRKRFMLIMLVAIFAAPPIASWFLFKFTEVGRGGAAGHGDLIVPPRQLPDVALADPAMARGGTARLRGKWTLMYLTPGACEDPCAAALYRMRQVRLALGTNADRVQRVLAFRGGAAPAADLATAWPGQLFLAGAGAETIPLEQFSLSPGEDPLLAGRIYLVDPLGNLMMSYASNTDPTGIVRDLKRLLRYSRIG